MHDGDADQRAEMPERARRVGGGTAEGTRAARQRCTARREDVREGTPLLMEEVLRRENVEAAYKRVVEINSEADRMDRTVGIPTSVH